MYPMIKAQWQRLTSNPAKILVFLLLPLILFTIGMQLSFSNSADLTFYYVDLDQTPISALYAENFGITVDQTLSTIAEAEEKILDNAAHFAIIIPQGFTDSLLAGNPIDIQLISIKTPDTTIMAEVRIKNLTDNLLTLAQASGLTSADASGVSRADAAIQLSVPGSTFANPASFGEGRQADTPSSTAADQLLSLYRQAFTGGITFRTETVTLNRIQGMRYGSGFSLMMLAFNCFSISGILLQDRQQGTLARIRTSPAKPLKQIFSTGIVGGFILLINVDSIALVNRLLYKVEAGPMTYLLLFMGSLIFLFLGMYISLTVRKSGAVSSLQTIIIVPTSMLSGAYWPIELMPDFMQKLAWLTPQYWVTSGIEKLARLSGSSTTGPYMDLRIGEVQLNLAVLSAFLILFVVLLAVRLKTMEDTESFT